MSPPRVRAAAPADLPVLQTLDAALFGADAWTRGAWSAELADVSGRFACVATLAETIVGYAVVRVTADVADLLRIGVAPDHQRLGVGSVLLSELVQGSRAVGARRLLLEVAEDNDPARAFYARQRFAVIATRPRYYSGDRDALVMARSLSVDALDEQRDG